MEEYRTGCHPQEEFVNSTAKQFGPQGEFECATSFANHGGSDVGSEADVGSSVDSHVAGRLFVDLVVVQLVDID